MKKHHKEEKKEGIKEGIVKTVNETIKRNLEDYKESMVKNIESRVESDFKQRIEKLETKLEKEVEDFLLKKFDSMMEKFSADIKQRSGGFEPSETKDFSVLKENVKEIMDIQEELVSKIQQKGPVDVGDFGRRINELSSSINVNGREIKKLSGQIEELRSINAEPESASVSTDAFKEMEDRISGLENKFEGRLEELQKNISGIASLMESQKSETRAHPGAEKAGENEQKLLSRISSLESELYGMKKYKKRNMGAVILE